MLPWVEVHEMLFERGGDDYVEWHCPYCQRRLRFYANPHRMVVLEPGNVQAIHHGAHGADFDMSVEIRQEQG